MTLVDADGLPIPSSDEQGIPIIQHTPSGRFCLRFLRRPPNIEAAAGLFIAQGGRFRVAMLEGNRLNFAATVDFGDGPFILTQETTPNGPEHFEAVDRVILNSVKYAHIVH